MTLLCKFKKIEILLLRLDNNGYLPGNMKKTKLTFTWMKRDQRSISILEVMPDIFLSKKRFLTKDRESMNLLIQYTLSKLLCQMKQTTLKWEKMNMLCKQNKEFWMKKVKLMLISTLSQLKLMIPYPNFMQIRTIVFTSLLKSKIISYFCGMN